MELQKELRLGNLVLDRAKPTVLKPSQLVNLIQGIASYEPIPITKQNIEKYIDWGFEFGFNKSIQYGEFWIVTSFLMENCIDGSSDFTINVCESKTNKDDVLYQYLYDDKIIPFGLDDTFHNLQNIFYISSGQELPIKKQ